MALINLRCRRTRRRVANKLIPGYGLGIFFLHYVNACIPGCTSRRNPRYPGIVLNFCRPSRRLGALWRWEILSYLDAAKSSAAFDKVEKINLRYPGIFDFLPAQASSGDMAIFDEHAIGALGIANGGRRSVSPKI